MKLCSVRLQCAAAPGVETMAVSPAILMSVIGLIIDASIPAGAGNAARTAASAERRKRRVYTEKGRTKGRHLECYSIAAGLP